jgi:uncharacterized phage-associated protein
MKKSHQSDLIQVKLIQTLVLFKDSTMIVNPREEVQDERLRDKNESELKKKKLNQVRTVFDVAEFFFDEYAAKAKTLDIVTLQKLCYYSQCHYLAEYNCSLFDEDFHNFEYGPCCKVLRIFVKKLRFYEKPFINLSQWRSNNRIFTTEQRGILEYVFHMCSAIPTFELSDISHYEVSCDNPWESTASGAIIEKNKLEQYFTLPFYTVQRKHWIKTYEDGHIGDVKDMDYVSYSMIRYIISNASINNINRMLGVMEEIESFSCQWINQFCHQSKKQAFMGSVFFPIQLEEPHDPPTHLFTNSSVMRLLYISHENGNPLANYWLSELLDFYSIDRKKGTFSEDVRYQYETQLKKNMDPIYPYFSMGRLTSLLLRGDPKNFYKHGEKYDPRCTIEVMKDRDQLKACVLKYPPAYAKLISLDRSHAQQYLNDASVVVPYAIYQLGCRENMKEKKIKYFQDASDRGVYSAVLALADLYFQGKEMGKCTKLLEEAGKSGWLHAYLKLGSMHEYIYKEKSKQYYNVNDLVSMIHAKEDDENYDTDQMANELYSIFTNRKKDN